MRDTGGEQTGDIAASGFADLLEAWNNGDSSAIELLFPIVEKELRRIAHNFMRGEYVGDPALQTTILVNEAYLQLIGQKDATCENRPHFFALAARIMRRILLTHARERLTQKRGGKAEHVPLDNVIILNQERSREILALDDALEQLSKFDETKSRIVELRYFGGLTLEETATVMGLAPITISVNWRLAKAWLAQEVNAQLEHT